jgi:hypothetical protein
VHAGSTRCHAAANTSAVTTVLALQAPDEPIDLRALIAWYAAWVAARSCSVALGAHHPEACEAAAGAGPGCLAKSLPVVTRTRRGFLRLRASRRVRGDLFWPARSPPSDRIYRFSDGGRSPGSRHRPQRRLQALTAAVALVERSAPGSAVFSRQVAVRWRLAVSWVDLTSGTGDRPSAQRSRPLLRGVAGLICPMGASPMAMTSLPCHPCGASSRSRISPCSPSDVGLVARWSPA